MAVSVYVPNFGRPAGRLGPVSLFKYPDPDCCLPVTLIVIPARQWSSKKPPTPRDAHWMLAWDIGKTGTGHIAQRRLHLVNESAADHLTSWGAMTVADEPEARPRKSIVIKAMTLSERRALEVIADNTEIQYPVDGWNAQDWCAEVLETARKEGLLSQEEADDTLTRARIVQIPAQ